MRLIEHTEAGQEDCSLLTKEEMAQLLSQIPSWKMMIDCKTIWKEYTFGNFEEGMAFANKIAILADAEKHHPSVTVSWGKVLVELSTHEVDGLSKKDFVLAAKIDAL